VGQSTVSEHLRQLAAVGFLLAEHRGTSRLYRINDSCVTRFPTAADLVMGHPSPINDSCVTRFPTAADLVMGHPSPIPPADQPGG
jgi:hypothetical protein